MEVFVVKHYTSEDRPTIKGNGFDGLEVGESREEAQAFVDFVNTAIAAERERADALRSVLRVIVEQDPVELVLDPWWSQRIAKGGLDATRAL